MAVCPDRFERKYGAQLLNRYDIVLFLGMFHILNKQLSMPELRRITEHLLDKTQKWFVVRTKNFSEFQAWIVGKGFTQTHEDISKIVGILRIYERET